MDDLHCPVDVIIEVEVKKMNNSSVRDLIAEIKSRPTMYLGVRSISCLKAFLDGWYLRYPAGVVDAEIMGKFQNWIENEYDAKGSQSWARIILFHSEDEYDALSKFFIDFDRFTKQL